MSLDHFLDGELVGETGEERVEDAMVRPTVQEHQGRPVTDRFAAESRVRPLQMKGNVSAAALLSSVEEEDPLG